MALATRCPHCQTTFRVANDQLKLHAGLVRCGACDEIFNGVEHLVAHPVHTTPSATPAPDAALHTAAHAAMRAPELVPEPVHETLAESVREPAAELASASLAQANPAAVDPAVDEAPTLSAAAMDFLLGEEPGNAAATVAPSQAVPETATADAAPAPAMAPALHLDAAPGTATHSAPSAEETNENGLVHHEPYLDETEHALAQQAEHAAASLSELAVEHEHKPDFVIQAEQAQRRSRLARVTMAVLSLLLLPLLLAQSAYALRNPLAAWFPDSKPLLTQACRSLHCELKLPAQIDQITIEANELQTLSEERKVFLLALQLQNHSSTVQAWPVVELVLNDAKDKALLQRSFKPAEYLANPADAAKGFAPVSEQNLKIYFELPKLKAAGYRVAVFYP